VIERERANLKTPQTLGNAFWHANSRQCFLACKLQPLFPGEHNIQTKLKKNTFKFHNFIYCCYTSRSSKIHKVHYVEFIFLLKSSKNRLQSTASRKLPDANENQFSRDRQKLHLSLEKFFSIMILQRNIQQPLTEIHFCNLENW